MLAHAFLNFMLDKKNAYDNFVQFNGYSPPQNTIDGDSLVKQGLIPKTLAAAVLRPDQFANNQELLALSVEGSNALAERLVEVQGGLSGESRWIWRVLAVPGVVWLSVFFLVAMYAVLCVALGNQNTLNEPVPFWNPLDWNVGYLLETLRNIWHGGPFLTVFLRTVAYVARRDGALAPDRLPRRLLRGAPRRPLARRWCCCCSSCRSGSTT